MIGIIILNYFNSALLASLMDDISRQHVQNPICIVDNSCDASEAANIKDLIKNNNLVVHLIVNDKNLGYFNGNLAGGDFLMNQYGINRCIIINPDVSSTQWKLVIESLAQNFHNESVFIVGPKIVIPNYKEVSSPLLRFHPYRECLIGFAFPFSHILQRIFILNSAKRAGLKFSVEGSAYMIDLGKMKAIVGFFSDIFLYGEEIIYGILAERFGWQIIYDNRVEILHHHPPRTRSLTYEKYLVDSMGKILVKFYKPNRIFRYLFLMSFAYKFRVRAFIMKLLKR